MSSKAPAEPAAPSKKGSLQAHLQRCAVPIQQASLMIRIQGESYPLADVDTLQGLLLDGWVPPHTPTYDRKREQWTEAQYFPGLSDSFQQSWSESRKAQIEQAGSTGPGKHTGWVSGEIKLGAAGASNVDPQQATLGMARFDPKMLEFPDEQTRAEQGMVLAARLGREAEAAASSQQYEQAIQIYERIVELDVRYPLLHRRLRELRGLASGEIQPSPKKLSTQASSEHTSTSTRNTESSVGLMVAASMTSERTMPRIPNALSTKPGSIGPASRELLATQGTKPKIPPLPKEPPPSPKAATSRSPAPKGGTAPRMPAISARKQTPSLLSRKPVASKRKSIFANISSAIFEEESRAGENSQVEIGIRPSALGSDKAGEVPSTLPSLPPVATLTAEDMVADDEVEEATNIVAADVEESTAEVTAHTAAEEDVFSDAEEQTAFTADEEERTAFTLEQEERSEKGTAFEPLSSFPEAWTSTAAERAPAAPQRPAQRITEEATAQVKADSQTDMLYRAKAQVFVEPLEPTDPGVVDGRSGPSGAITNPMLKEPAPATDFDEDEKTALLSKEQKEQSVSALGGKGATVSFPSLPATPDRPSRRVRETLPHTPLFQAAQNPASDWLMEECSPRLVDSFEKWLCAIDINNTLHLIDLESGSIRNSLLLPYACERMICVSAFLGLLVPELNSVVILSLPKLEAVGEIELGAAPTDMVRIEGERLCVACPNAQSLWVVDPRQPKRLMRHPVGGAPTRLRACSVGVLIWHDVISKAYDTAGMSLWRYPASSAS